MDVTFLPVPSLFRSREWRLQEVQHCFCDSSISRKQLYPEEFATLTKRLGPRYKLYHSPDGAHALAALTGYQVDAFVVTEDLPDMTGEELIKSVHSSSPTVAGVLIHAQAGADSRENGTAAGVGGPLVEYLSMPVGDFTLMKAIDDATMRRADPKQADHPSWRRIVLLIIRDSFQFAGV